jgi:predicted alpha/beta-fold hydrolase
LRSSQRERLETEDGDFLWVDRYLPTGASKAILIIAHGMEGSSRTHYVKGLAQTFLEKRWEVWGWNMRGCGGEPNLKPHAYHSGLTTDLHCVVLRAMELGLPLALAGFSLGGNTTLKYLGEREDTLPAALIGGFAVSVPCDLEASADRLDARENRLYWLRFRRRFHEKMREKHFRFPDQVPSWDRVRPRTIREFDDAYTAPFFGYRNASHYWSENRCLNFLSAIRKPTLLLQSLDDPLLTPSCIPTDIAENHSHLSLEIAENGGHCGFIKGFFSHRTFAEERALEFLENCLNGKQGPSKSVQ